MDSIVNPILKILFTAMIAMVILDSVEWGFNGTYDNNAGGTMSGMINTLVNTPAYIICQVFYFIAKILEGVLNMIFGLIGGSNITIDFEPCSLN